VAQKRPRVDGWLAARLADLGFHAGCDDPDYPGL
jgi:hypothetical protein